MVEKVKALIAMLVPEAICDDCIAERLTLGSADAAQAARELLGEKGLERRKDACVTCGRTQVTTRRSPR